MVLDEAVNDEEVAHRTIVGKFVTQAKENIQAVTGPDNNAWRLAMLDWQDLSALRFLEINYLSYPLTRHHYLGSSYVLYTNIFCHWPYGSKSIL